MTSPNYMNDKLIVQSKIRNCFYLILADELMAGKNMPSRLKFLKYPGIFIPLKKKVMMGTERSKATPILSPFLICGTDT